MESYAKPLCLEQVLLSRKLRCVLGPLMSGQNTCSPGSVYYTLNSIFTPQRVADDKRGLSELRWFKTRVQKSPVRIRRFTGVCGCCFL